MNRREFLKYAAPAPLAVATLPNALLGSACSQAPEERSLRFQGQDAQAAGRALALNSGGRNKNLLVIIVDEMREPFTWIPAPAMQAYLPNLYRLWTNSVYFKSHYTASIACSPSRACMVTGLYGHQTGLLATIMKGFKTPYLQPAFPTYGTALGALGYDTPWIGKWHLSDPQNPNVAAYGFQGGTTPDPYGGAGMGETADPATVATFSSWLANRAAANASDKPFCATVSLVNPHDVYYFYTQSNRIATEAEKVIPAGFGDFLSDSYFQQLGNAPCANFEDPYSAKFMTGKPGLQTAYAAWFDLYMGAIPHDQDKATYGRWFELLRLYFLLHQQVDAHVGQILAALQQSPFADDTLVVFTSDHGEYAGAHGLRGKGDAAYEEALNVPLAVYDPSGTYGLAPGMRDGLTSHVDLMPLLISLATGGTQAWSAASPYPYLAQRWNMLPMLNSSAAPGRPYVLFSSDEPDLGALTLPNYHLVTVRTKQGKYTNYSKWASGSYQILPDGQAQETYDYRGGDLTETNNVASKTNDLTTQLHTLLLGQNGQSGLLATELRAPLPEALQAAQSQAFQGYFKL